MLGTSGHAHGWGYGHPEILTRCFDRNGEITDILGPMNVISNTTWSFLKNFFEEVADTFPDGGIHFGGDEVDPECWWVQIVADYLHDRYWYRLTLVADLCLAQTQCIDDQIQSNSNVDTISISQHNLCKIKSKLRTKDFYFVSLSGKKKMSLLYLIT